MYIAGIAKDISNSSSYVLYPVHLPLDSGEMEEGVGDTSRVQAHPKTGRSASHSVYHPNHSVHPFESQPGNSGNTPWRCSAGPACQEGSGAEFLLVKSYVIDVFYVFLHGSPFCWRHFFLILDLAAKRKWGKLTSVLCTYIVFKKNWPPKNCGILVSWFV